MTTIANCFSLADTQRLQMALDSAGIRSFIPDEHTAAIAPHHFLSPSGVRLQVADEDAEQARRIAAQVQQGS